MYDIVIAANTQLRELRMFIAIAAHALRLATRRREMLDLVRRIDEHLGETTKQPDPDEQAHGAALEAFAHDQSQRGLPFLFDLGSIRLWGILEACVDDLVARALQDPDKCKDQETLGRLKGPLVPFRSASPSEQAEYLADLLRNSVDAPLKPGVGRFEAILDPVGLSGNIDELVRKVLFELSQVRNLVVHRAARVDKRFAESCPWRLKRVGDLIETSHASFWLYYNAAYWYVASLRLRLEARDRKETRLTALMQELVDIIGAAYTAREKEEGAKHEKRT